MHIPKYWAKGECEGLRCFRWSDRSVADAKSAADEAARTLVERFKQGLLQRGTGADSYGYGNGPLREELVKEVSRKSGDLSAAVTRNSYGCAILNCTDVLFVDIDLPEQPASSPGGGFLGKLFGKKPPAPPADLRAEALARVEQAVTRSEASARVYATKAGLRVLFTHSEFNPKDREVHELFELLGADPLYVRLCKRQETFRARLTPKPWRMSELGSHPPARWPFENERIEQQFRSWLERYDRIAENYATCSLLKTIGTRTTKEIAAVTALHDQYTKSDSGLPLA